ncbi:MAG: flavin reductase family protein [Actinomycetota bacterium]
MTGEIHEGENPFFAPEEARDAIRSLRGRLVAPVTIVTAGGGDGRAGLTVSSIEFVQGEPGTVHFTVGPTADVYDAIRETDRFVVHVLSRRHRDLSEIFAGRRPSPGGPFAEIGTTSTDWGPVIGTIPDRAFCSGASASGHGHSLLVIATVDRAEVSDLTDPLVYFRGRYRGLE